MHLNLEGGTIDVTAEDDAVHSDGAIHVSGDAAVTAASGDDGLHADVALRIDDGTVAVTRSNEGIESAALEIAGGTLTVWGPTQQGNGALDVNGTFLVSGGELLAIGSGGMAVSPSTDSSQASTTISASGSAGDTVRIESSSGTLLTEFVAEKAFSSIVYSSPDVEDGETYSASVAGEPPMLDPHSGITGCSSASALGQPARWCL